MPKLDLTREELCVVHSIMALVGGCPFTSHRKYADSIAQKIDDLGLGINTIPSPFYEYGSRIYFKDGIWSKIGG